MENNKKSVFNDEFAGSNEIMGELSSEDEAAVEKALRNIASQMTDSEESYDNQAPYDSLDTEEENETDKTEQREDVNSQTEETEKDNQAVSEENVEPEEIPQETETAEQTEENAELTEETESETRETQETIAEETEETETQETKEVAEEEKIETEKTEETEQTQTEPDLKEEEIKEENVSKQETDEKETDEDIPSIDDFEDNDVVKKYIVYISKDFVPYINDMTIDERSAYINDALQLKIDAQDEEKAILEKKKITAHIVIAVAVIIIFMPTALLIAHKSIMATFENYKYSQDNFEKLYKQRFKENSAYLRSLEYNKEYEKKAKNENSQKNHQPN